MLNKYIQNNLDFWKNKKWDENKLIEIIKKYKLKVAKIQIRKGIFIKKIYNTNENDKLRKAKVFLSSIVKEYPFLDTYIYLNISDTLLYDKISIYNINGKKGNDKNLDDFIWGVSSSDPNYIKIVDSESIIEYNNSFPIFCFERERNMKGVLFPTFGADNNNFETSEKIDKILFNDKNIDIPIFRNKNICCDINNFDKIRLVYFSSINKDKTDFKFCSNKKHNMWNKFIISKSLLNFCKNTEVIDKNTNINKFREEYFNQDNFVSYDFLFQHKFIITCGSAKNRKFYNSNSCILEYKFKNKEFFHEDLFSDMEIFYFDEENLFGKLDKLKENNYHLANIMIKKRLQIYDDYLEYSNLVKWYGKFLLEYQNMFS